MQKARCLNSVSEVVPQDLIGKADPISNLRPVKFHVPKTETEIEKLFRTEQVRVQEWNHKFWSRHNETFKKEKERFRAKHVLNESNENSIKSDEISVFYKDFLDKNWKTHYEYNMKCFFAEQHSAKK